MKIQLELTERELKELVFNHFEGMLGDIPLKEDDIIIEVKSKQNFKSEWETAAFRARVNKLA